MSYKFFDSRLKWIAILSLILILIFFNFGPIPQEPSAHVFADRRTFFGIVNFLNIVTNLPLIVVGNLGMRLVSMHKAQGGLQSLMPVYFIFFAGVFLSGFGSCYYHYQPNNHTLVWDRLPMTIAFMGFFAIVIGEFISDRLGLKLAIPLLATGFASVIYWYLTELGGRGDLRFYALVQFLPLILIPVILYFYKTVKLSYHAIVYVLIAYALAKISELYDSEIYHLTHWLSGHSLKHILAALGVYGFYRELANGPQLPDQIGTQSRRA